MPKTRDTLPAAPLAEWVRDRLEALEPRCGPHGDLATDNGHPTTPLAVLSTRLGVDPKLLKRWRNQLNSRDEPTETHPRPAIEDAIDRYGINLVDVFPDVVEAERRELEVVFA